MGRRHGAGEMVAARGLALALAAAGHTALFLLLALALGRQPMSAEPPVIRVVLIPAHIRPPPRTERPRPPGPATRRAATTAAREPDELVVLPQTRAEGSPGVGLPEDERIRKALRGRLGCNRATLLDLTAEERARCERQLAAGDARDPQRLDLDPRGDYARDSEPVLSRRPKNGCRVRAAGDRGAMGEHGAAAGVTCALSF